MRKIAYIPLKSAPERFIDYSAYKELFGYDNSYQFYGAFYKGQQVGYGSIKDGEIVHVSSVDPEVDSGLYYVMQLHGNSDSAILSKGKAGEPKDMINAPIPFIYDVHKKHIQIGYEGEKTRDIKPYRGEFSNGGIVEGEYQPGGKIIVYPSNTALYTTRGISNTWIKQFPQMEITSIEMEVDGKTHKVAGLAADAEMVPIDFLKKYQEFDRNPNVEESTDPNYWNKLKEHIGQNGFEDPLTLEYDPDNGTGYLGEGNHRLGIAQELGMTHVPVHIYRSRQSQYHPYQKITEPGQYVDERGYFPQSAKPSSIGIPVSGDPYSPSQSNWYKDMYPEKYSSQMDPGQYVRVLASSDPAASQAYEALRFAGGKVYAVGGAVRDALRGENPKDIDLLVAGLPTEEVHNILDKLPGRVDLTGKKFGVYRYRHDGAEVEIALPRQDKYETSRRGEGVITVDHNLPVDKDLERRDFTVNSMAVDLDNGELIDPYGGQNDLEKHLLRTTHPDSFKEDPTRLVRALTAHSRFGLNPDEKTRGEMVSNADRLRGESPDALNKIVDKLFASHNPASAIRLAHETGVLKHLFPEVDDNWDFDQKSKYHKYSLGDHSMHVLDNISKETTDPDLRMTGMLHDIGKPASAWRGPDGHLHFYHDYKTNQGADHETVGAKMANDRLRALNYPVARINRVTHLIQHHMFPRFNTQKGARKFINKVGDQHADDLLTHAFADGAGHGMEDYWASRTPVDTMRGLVDEVRKGQQPTDLNNLAINGNDLIQLGIPQGPQIGQVLRNLLDHVIEVPTDNNYEKLTQLAQGYANATPGTNTNVFQ